MAARKKKPPLQKINVELPNILARYEIDNAKVSDVINRLVAMNAPYQDLYMKEKIDWDGDLDGYVFYYTRDETPEEYDARVNAQVILRAEQVKRVKMQLAVYKNQYPELFE